MSPLFWLAFVLLCAAAGGAINMAMEVPHEWRRYHRERLALRRAHILTFRVAVLEEQRRRHMGRIAELEGGADRERGEELTRDLERDRANEQAQYAADRALTERLDNLRRQQSLLNVNEGRQHVVAPEDRDLDLLHTHPYPYPLGPRDLASALGLGGVFGGLNR